MRPLPKKSLFCNHPVTERPHSGEQGCPTGALGTEGEGKGAVVLRDLGEMAIQEARPATGARRCFGPGYCGCMDMLAGEPATALEIGTLAHVAAPADGDLVDAGGGALGGNEPDGRP